MCLTGKSSWSGCSRGKKNLTQGGYCYAPAGKGIGWRNVNGKVGRILLYKQRYIPHPQGLEPWTVFGNINEIAFRDYDEMANVHQGFPAGE